MSLTTKEEIEKEMNLLREESVIRKKTN